MCRRFAQAILALLIISTLQLLLLQSATLSCGESSQVRKAQPQHVALSVTSNIADLFQSRIRTFGPPPTQVLRVLALSLWLTWQCHSVREIRYKPDSVVLHASYQPLWLVNCALLI